MPGNLAATVNLRHAFVLAPEAVLAAFGLVVLLVDLGLLRGRSSADRRVLLTRLTLAGTLLCLVSTLLPQVRAE